LVLRPILCAVVEGGGEEGFDDAAGLDEHLGVAMVGRGYFGADKGDNFGDERCYVGDLIKGQF